MALTKTQVSELYTAIFNRASEGDGNAYWAGLNASAATIAQGMLDTTDAATYFGTSLATNQAFVEHIYLNTLNKTVAQDATGIAYWVDLLDAGHTRGEVVSGLVSAVADYATSTDATTLAAYNQFTNRVAVSDYTADTLATAPSDYATSTSFSSGLTVTDAIGTVTTAKTSIATKAETVAVANYDAALVTYNAAVATAGASKAAADALTTDVSSVALATASQTAATTAKTDADAVVTAAAALTTTSAKTPSVIDDAAATAAVNSAAAAAALAGVAVTTAATAVTTATQAAADAAAVGSTFALTTGDDVTMFGTTKSDTWTGTQATYNTGDIIVDSSSIDSDTLTVTATNDITATATVVGIENVNFNLNAVTSSGTANTFEVATDSISSGTVKLSVTKAGSSVTKAAVTALKTGMTAATDLATFTVGSIADADITVNMTATTASTLADVTGTVDNLTINASGNFTLSESKAEEKIVINGDGTVTVADATAVTDTLSSLTVTAAKAITITDYSNIGNMTLTATTGNVLVGVTNNDASGNLSVTANAGNIDINDATDIVGTVTVTATGDAGAITDIGNLVADGDITDVAAANAIGNVVLTASNAIVAATLTAATNVTATAGAASTLTDITAVTDLTLASTSTASTAVAFTLGAGNLTKLQNLTFTGSNNVTAKIDAADLVTSVGNLVAPQTKIKATDSSTGTSRIEFLANNGSTALDISDLAVDEIAFSTQALAANDSFTVATGANLVNKIDQTNDLVVTAAAVSGNTLTVTIEDDAVTTTVSEFAGGITTTNIATLTINNNDAASTEALDLGTINVAVGNSAVLAGTSTDAVTIDAVVATSINTSSYAGNVTFGLVDNGATVTTGAGNDNFTSNTAENLTITAGEGTDTLTLTGADYSASTLTLSGIDVIKATAGTILSGAQTTLKSYVINTAALTINGTVAAGETIDLKGISNSTTVTVNGNAGADTITGSKETAMVLNGLGGGDTITGGDGADIINSDSVGTKNVQEVTVVSTVTSGTTTLTYLGHTVTFTSTAGAGAASDDAEVLLMVSAINSDSAMSALVTASVSTVDGDILLLTSKTDGVVADIAITAAASDADITVVNAAGAGESVVGVSGTASNDTITAGNGADAIVMGGGANTVNLAETIAAVDTVLFTDGNIKGVTGAGMTTINDFAINSDKLDFDAMTGILNAAVDVAANAAKVANADDSATYVFANGADGTGTEVITDYTSTSDVAAFLDAGLTSASGEDYIAVINDLVGDDAYIYHIVDAGGDTTISAAEVFLIGKVNNIGTTPIDAGDIA